MFFTTNSKLQELFFSFLCLQNGTTLKLHTLMYQAVQININAIFHIKAKIIFNAWPNSCWTLLIRLRLKFNHLNEHNFRHKFKDCVRPCVTAVLKLKQLKHFLLALLIPSQSKTKNPRGTLFDESFSYTEFQKWCDICASLC